MLSLLKPCINDFNKCSSMIMFDRGLKSWKGGIKYTGFVYYPK